MKTKIVPITTVKPYEKKPKNNNRALGKVADSIREFGFRQPIVVDSEYTIIVGHTRLFAAKKLILLKVP